VSPLLLLLPLATAASWTAPFPAGTYAMRLETATLAKVPVLGRTRGGSVSWMVGELAEDGGRAWTWRTCAVEMQGAPGKARMGLSPAFIAAMGQKRLEAEVAPAPGGWRFALDMGEDHVGYDPRQTNRLPQDISDPAVTDWDRDGQPAATIDLQVPMVGAVELYVAQRAHVQLAGRTDAATGVTQGSVQFTRFEQRTLGASHRMFDANPEMWPDPDRSGFELRPLPAGAGCEDVQTGFGGD
jgi:hypothetical protein